MACSNGCGTSCSTDCTHSSSGGCGGSCGGSCSTNCTGGCSGYCDGTCKGGSGSSCSDCTAKCANDCTGACTNACVTGCTGCGGNCSGTCSGTCDAICASSCNDGCSSSCDWNCDSTCTGNCSAACANDCSGCSGSCSGCSGTCSGSCSGDCNSGCYTGCSGCDSTCSGSCTGTCNTTCTTTCANDCTGGCKGTCTGGCGGSCDNSCGFSCEASCDNNCTAVCSVSSVYGESEKNILEFNYTGSAHAVTLNPGKYVLECWGAQGGGLQNNSSLDTAAGGMGGYSVGTLTLTSRTTIYVYVGGMGKSTGSGLAEGGFNGGGAAYGSSTGEPGNGGGGATDVRIGRDSLYARVIVAGGGGGAGEDSGDRPGVGGGVTGGTSSGHSTPATQTSTGTGGVFGRGANTAYDGGAGGGGWYGGGTNGGSQTIPTSNDGNDTSGGCGGSGYVYTGPTASNYPSGCLLNSSYYLTDAQTIGGDQSFKSPTGTSETGHADNGYCRITCYVKKKTLHCKMNNEIKKATPVFIKMNNKIYDAGANAIMDFGYTGAVQTISLPKGQYIIECWGAQGGYRSSSDYGGKGGYSIGTLTLTKSTDLFIYVGGSGNSVSSTNSSGYYPGGFNGGGYRYGYRGGGGATDVRIGKDSLYARIIVAGGGGSDGAPSYGGGYAGGTSGARGTFGCGSYGYGGDQTASYTSLNAIASQGTTNSSSNCAAGFGFGGFGCYTSSGYGGAGGGGWYGGQGTYPDGSGDDDGGGGGGSGYVYTSSTASNYPNGNYVNSSYYLTDAQTIAGNQSFKSPDGTNETGHTGNGFCRITRKSGKIFVKQNGSWIKV